MNKAIKKEQVEAEIKKLRALGPVGTVGELMQRRIGLVIEELTKGIKSFHGFTPTEREMIAEVRRWRDGTTQGPPPSSGWESFVRP
jgi:hypothetical protein